MAHIEISNLNIAGSDLLAGSDSFLTELQDTDTTNILGGSGYKKGKSHKGKSNKGKSRKGKSGRGCFSCSPCH